MKKLFIYYSLTGNGDAVATYLQEKTIDIRKVETKRELPKNRILQIIMGGYLAGIHHKPELVNFNPNISKYDEIIIGSPVWNARLSCPINTVLDKIDLHNKKVTFIFYSGSGKIEKLSTEILNRYRNAKIINLREPKSNLNEIKEKLNEI